MNHIPFETVVRLKKTGEMAIIKQIFHLNDQKSFLNYLGIIEGRGKDDLYALYHDDIELECLPPEHLDKQPYNE